MKKKIQKTFNVEEAKKWWCGDNWKYVIIKINNDLEISGSYRYEYLAFHTKEQAELFLKENEDLVKDYYMMD